VNKDDIPLRNVIDEYLQYHDGLNHSPKTVRWYSDILLSLNVFLGGDARLADLTVRRLRAYQSHLRARCKPNGKPLTDETLHDHTRGRSPRLASLADRLVGTWSPRRFRYLSLCEPEIFVSVPVVPRANPCHLALPPLTP
jgi:hypothetical protein